MRSLTLLLLLAAPTWAAPPKLTIPAEVRPSGQYVDFVPETDAVSITYVGLDGIDPVPSRRLAEKTAFLLDTYGKPAKRYRFAAVASSKDGEQTRADFVVIVGTPTTPITPPPGTEPPPVTEPPKPGVYFFTLIRPDGPAAPSFTRMMGLSGWDELRKAGHGAKDYTLSDAAKLGIKLAAGTPLPCVVTLQEAADGKASKIVRGAVALPPEMTTNDTIAELLKAVK